MMPKTSVNPAASRNSSKPNCSPFRNCSTISSMDTSREAERHRTERKTAAAHERRRSIGQGDLRSLHRTFVVEAVLAVFNDGGDGFQRQFAVGVLHHVLQIEVLDRDVVVAVFERPAHRLEV